MNTASTGDHRLDLIVRASIPSTLALKALALSGFDTVLIDRQHGLIDDRSMLEMLAFGREASINLYVRPVSADPEEIGRILDAGASGIFVPMINEPEQAQAVVDATRYPPGGTRSWGRIWPVSASAAPVLSYPPPNPPMVVVMVETVRGLEAITSIAAVEGVDCVHLGLNDLALSAGIDVNPLEHPILRQKILGAVQAVTDAGTRVGLHIENPQELEFWTDQGCNLYVVGSDVSLLMRGARSILSDLASEGSSR